MPRKIQGEGSLTGIELLAIGLKRAPVMDVDRVTLVGLPLALDRERDFDLEIVRGQDTDGGRGEQRKRQENTLHLDCRAGGRASRLGISGKLGDVEAGRGLDCFLGLSKMPGNNTGRSVGMFTGRATLAMLPDHPEALRQGSGAGAESMQGSTINCIPSVALTARERETGNTAGTVRSQTQPRYRQGEPSRPAALSLHLCKSCCVFCAQHLRLRCP